ncbi:7791_t:CDS:2, partial [Racocetra persica]
QLDGEQLDGEQLDKTSNTIQKPAQLQKNHEASVEVVIPSKRKELSSEVDEPFQDFVTSSNQNETANDGDQNETDNEDSVFAFYNNDYSDFIPSDIEYQSPQPSVIPLQLEYFCKFFEKMDENRKWILESGKCVENTIFKHCKELNTETYLHSWIIDLEDQDAERLFTTEEWNEIKSEAPKLPKVNPTFAEFIMKFVDIKSTSELRQLLETTPFRNKDEPYDRQQHYNIEWVELIMKEFLIHYEDPNEPLKKSHLESWYDINVWSFIVDHGLRNIDGMEIV